MRSQVSNPSWTRLATFVVTTFFALSVALTLSGRASAASAALDRIAENGVLRVGMSGNQQPFNFVYGKKKQVVGLDVDLATEIAYAMQVELEVVTIPFNDLLDALEEGAVDLVISGMTITAARTRDVSFVGPYTISGKSLLAGKGLTKKLKTPGQFNQAGVKLAALKGSTSESLVQRDLSAVTLVSVEDYDEGIAAVMSGDVDGMVADTPILAFTKNQYRNAGLQLVEPPLSSEPMGIVLSKDDPQLENFVRNYIAVFEKTGVLMSLYRRWFELGGGKMYRP